jgi:hypothetical protein
MPREIPVTVARFHPESAGWLRALAETGPQGDTALARLRELVVRVARGEVARRAPRLQMTTRNHELVQQTLSSWRQEETGSACRCGSRLSQVRRPRQMTPMGQPIAVSREASMITRTGSPPKIFCPAGITAPSASS